MIIENLLVAAKDSYSAALRANEEKERKISRVLTLTSQVSEIFNGIHSQDRDVKGKALNGLIQANESGFTPNNQFIQLKNDLSKAWPELEKTSFVPEEINKGNQKLNEAISLFNDMNSNDPNYKAIASLLKSVKTLRDQVQEGLNALRDSAKKLLDNKADTYDKQFNDVETIQSQYLEMVKKKYAEKFAQNQTSLFSATAKQQSQTVGKQTSAPEQPKNSAPSIKKVT